MENKTRKIIAGMKVEQLVEFGILPHNLNWNGAFPPSYSVLIFSNGTKSVIAVSDAFGGRTSFAIFDGVVNTATESQEVPSFLDAEERVFLKEKNPALLSAIENL